MKRAQRKKEVQIQYRHFYFHNRPTWDIKRQATGEADEKYTLPVIHVNISERSQLAEILINRPENLDYQELLDLRIRAADLITSVIRKREMKIAPVAG